MYYKYVNGGDLLDRGQQSEIILLMMYFLHRQCRKLGLKIPILLLGNHETYALSDETICKKLQTSGSSSIILWLSLYANSIFSSEYSCLRNNDCIATATLRERLILQIEVLSLAVEDGMFSLVHNVGTTVFSHSIIVMGQLQDTLTRLNGLILEMEKDEIRELDVELPEFSRELEWLFPINIRKKAKINIEDLKKMGENFSYTINKVNKKENLDDADVGLLVQTLNDYNIFVQRIIIMVKNDIQRTSQGISQTRSNSQRRSLAAMSNVCETFLYFKNSIAIGWLRADAIWNRNNNINNDPAYNLIPGVTYIVGHDQSETHGIGDIVVPSTRFFRKVIEADVSRSYAIKEKEMISETSVLCLHRGFNSSSMFPDRIGKFSTRYIGTYSNCFQETNHGLSLNDILKKLSLENLCVPEYSTAENKEKNAPEEKKGKCKKEIDENLMFKQSVFDTFQYSDLVTSDDDSSLEFMEIRREKRKNSQGNRNMGGYEFLTAPKRFSAKDLENMDVINSGSNITREVEWEEDVIRSSDEKETNFDLENSPVPIKFCKDFIIGKIDFDYIMPGNAPVENHVKEKRVEFLSEQNGYTCHRLSLYAVTSLGLSRAVKIGDIYDNGEQYEGAVGWDNNYENVVRDGFGICKKPNGLVIFTLYLDNREKGPGLLIDNNNIYLANWRNGKISGIRVIISMKDLASIVDKDIAELDKSGESTIRRSAASILIPVVHIDGVISLDVELDRRKKIRYNILLDRKDRVIVCLCKNNEVVRIDRELKLSNFAKIGKNTSLDRPPSSLDSSFSGSYNPISSSSSFSNFSNSPNSLSSSSFSGSLNSSNNPSNVANNKSQNLYNSPRQNQPNNPNPLKTPEPDLN
jgi:hypothetical protein